MWQWSVEGRPGMAAALAAAANARVVLVDDQPALGGSLRYELHPGARIPGIGEESGPDASRRLAMEIAANDRIEVLSEATAFGLYEGRLLGISQGGSMIRLRAGRIVIATGSHETPLVFDRNDIPGVMLSTGLQRLINLYGVKPGTTAMVGTTGDQGYYAALDLLQSGMRVAVLADSRPAFPDQLDAARELRNLGVLVLPSHTLARAEGVKKVVGGVVSRLQDGRTTTEERQFDADIIAMSGGFEPAASLLQQAGARVAYDEASGGTRPSELPEGVFAAGGAAGSQGLREAILQGRLAGTEASPRPNASESTAELRRNLEDAQTEHTTDSAQSRPPFQGLEGSKQMVCFCEDVTSKDIATAVDEGFQDIQILKRYSTVTMGPCQGKMCHRNFVDIAAVHTGSSAGDLGSTTARPPVQPISLGTLAGPAHIPVKHTPLDRKHRALGAEMLDSNMWQRPRLYGSVQGEAMAVRNAVGIIDVSTLGKLDVRGRDAPALLDRLYTHSFSTLRNGRVRYGVLCADNGTIMDDGTVTRLAEDRYFVTTSTASVEAIEEWFKWWNGRKRHVRPRHQRHVGVRGHQRCRSAGARDSGQADRRRPVVQGLPLHAGQGGQRRRGADPDASHRVRGRDGLGAALPRRVRGARMGRPDGRGQRVRHSALWDRDPAGAQAGEDAHHPEPGHGHGHQPARRRDEVGGQDGQGRLHRSRRPGGGPWTARREASW